MRDIGRDEQVCFCRITQMGLLRVLSGAYATGVAPMTQIEAWDTYESFFGDERVSYVEEPLRLEQTFQRISGRHQVTPKLWTDDYLAAFAEVGGLTLITFDKALAARVSGAILLTP